MNCIEINKESEIYKIAKTLHEIYMKKCNKYGKNPNFNCDILESEYGIRIYTNQNNCFDIERSYICEPKDVEENSGIEGLQEDGFVYSFSETWDGFDKVGINKAYSYLTKIYEEQKLKQKM